MHVSQVIGTGSYLPGEPVTADVLAEIIGAVAHDIVKALGAEQRYWALDPATGRATQTSSDMAAKAARAAMNDGGVGPDEIDLLISVTATPDYPLPANAPLIQEKLGIQRCAAMELRAGCNGVVQALAIADQFLRTGTYRTALVIGSEMASTYTIAPLLRDEPNLTRVDLLNAVMFGDGAGAALLRAHPDPAAPGVIGTYLGSIGVGKEAGFILPAGGSVRPFDPQTLADGAHRWVHDYKAIAMMDREMGYHALSSIVACTGIDPQEIQLVIVPQANAERLKAGIQAEENPLSRYADRFFVNVGRVGNTSAAGVLVALDEVNRARLLRPGQLCLLIGAESSKWLCGAVALRWVIDR